MPTKGPFASRFSEDILELLRKIARAPYKSAMNRVKHLEDLTGDHRGNIVRAVPVIGNILVETDARFQLLFQQIDLVEELKRKKSAKTKSGNQKRYGQDELDIRWEFRIVNVSPYKQAILRPVRARVFCRMLVEGIDGNEKMLELILSK